MIDERLDDKLAASELKACCALAYEGAWARLLGGEALHPGGLELTRHLAAALRLDASHHVLDVASGVGASAIAIARASGCRVTGVDLSPGNVEAARAAAGEAGLGALVAFEVGDAERLPFPDAAFDAVICECAFCTFPDKPTAAAEIARVLRPGGRLGLADLTRSGELPADLRTLAAWITCVGDARPLDEYVAVLAGAGLRVEHTERRDDALRELVRTLRLRLVAAEVAAKLGKIDLPLDQIPEAKRLVRAALDAVERGRLGYALVIAHRERATP